VNRFAPAQCATLVLAAILPAEQVYKSASRQHYQDVLRDFYPTRGHGVLAEALYAATAELFP
jgi:hypothetical protein